MSFRIASTLFALVCTLPLQTFAADRYVSLVGGHVPPFTSWAEAATNIQDAIDASLAGDTVWVTNGVYATSGKAMGGTLTNRVALNKAMTLRSVNGPTATVIDGGSLTNGLAAIRCAWLTNGAVLSGFTLTRGGTRNTGSIADQQGYGGGVWGASTNATVTNCIITTNFAYFAGGGAYQVTVLTCELSKNRAIGSGTPAAGAGGGSGGGAANCVLKNCVLKDNGTVERNGGGTANSFLQNCLLTGNSTFLHGGAAYQSTLLNCTVTDNIAGGYNTVTGGGAVANSILTNCIVYGNQLRSPYPNTAVPNHHNSTFAYSCTTPGVVGDGNIEIDPLLLVDGIHLAAGSPCRGSGTNSIVNGADLDGQPWSNPPSMGCDEWQPNPIIIAQPAFSPSGSMGSLNLQVQLAGAEPFAGSWRKDGTILNESSHYVFTTNTTMRINGLGPEDAGTYMVVVTNDHGSVTSSIVELTLHFVAQDSLMPVAPYSDWSNAATNIQDAIEAASSGAFILVTNGVYATGGKAITGGLTNRVALDKAVTVLSVNGPLVTTIQGAWDPISTNGPASIRCAWVTNGATLNGFTLTGGATQNSISPQLGTGGGAWCNTISNAVVANCLIISNVAHAGGGGTRYGHILNSAILGNTVFWGSGSAGGSLGGRLVNCTIVNNLATVVGGGQQDASLTNCIIYYNQVRAPQFAGSANNAGGIFDHCCSPNLTPGFGGNLNVEPQLLDGYHLAVTSPCRGAGTNIVTGTDLDGEAWMNPPSIGCDEVWEAALNGPLSVSASAAWPTVAERGSLPLTGSVSGSAARVGWEFGNGDVLTNASLLSTSYVWSNAGNYTVTFTAFNNEHPTGVSTNLEIQVVPLLAPAITNAGFSGTNFSLSFHGQPGVTYMVQQATNLVPPVAWQSVGTVSSTGQVMQVIDTKPTNAMRFYRVQGP